MSESVGLRAWARRWMVGTALALGIGCWLAAVAPAAGAEERPADLVLHWRIEERAAVDSEETAHPGGPPEGLEVWMERRPETDAGDGGDIAEAESGDPRRRILGYEVQPLPPPAADDPGPVDWVLERACRPGHVLLLVSPERMTLPLTVQNHHCDEGVEIRQLMDRATVASRVLPPREDAVRRAASEADEDGAARIWQAPPAGWLEVQECSMDPRSGRPPPPVRVPLRVPDSGDWWLPVPARECQHLTLKLAELSPTTWWGVALETGEETTLEPRRLQRGASVLVQVTSDQDGRSLAGVEVAIFEEQGVSPTLRDVRTDRPRPFEEPAVAEGRSGDWGWVRLAGLPSGFYLLRAVHRPSLAARVTEPLELTAGETVLDLELLSPARLVLEPDPDAEPFWDEDRVAVHIRPGGSGLGADLSRHFEQVTSEGVTFDGLSPGPWIVVVALGDQEIFGREVELSPGEERRLSVSPDRPLRQGLVLLRGEPVQGELTFDPVAEENDDTSASAPPPEPPEGPVLFFKPHAVSDEEGRFELYMTAGRYKVQFRPAEESRWVVTPPLEVQPEDREIEVRLPGGRITGWVEDEDGGAVERPRILALRLADFSGEKMEPLASTGTGEEDGQFVLDTLAAGDWQIQVEARDGRQGQTEVSLAPDELRDGVRIVVGEETTVSGRVVTASGRPAAMARGAGFLVEPGGGVPSMVDLRTDAQGRFELDVPARPGAQLFLQITGPGIPVSGLHASLGEELELVVPEQGGRVRFQGPPSHFAQGSFLLLTADGGLVNPAVFATTPGGPVVTGEGEMVIPRLAVGSWRAVVVPDPQAAAAFFRGDFTGLRTLATFVVEPGGSVEVTLE